MSKKQAFIDYVEELIVATNENRYPVVMSEDASIYWEALKAKEETENKNEKIKMLEQLEEIRKEKYLEILYSNPAGFLLTARLTTNYRCLRNIYI